MLDEQKVIKTVEEKLNRKVSMVNPILEKGTVNTIFILDLMNGDKVIVRLNTADSLDQFKKEQWCIKQSEQKGILGPGVLELDIEDNFVFMIQSFITGIHGEESQDKSKIWRSLGEYASLIHQVPTRGFGDHMVEPGSFNGSWNKFLNYNIESLTEDDRLIKDGVFTTEQSLKIKELFTALRDESFNFSLNHGDISLKNSIVDDKGNVFLIDWGSAESNIIPHFDLIEIIKSSFNLDTNNSNFKSFLEGYGISDDQFDNLLPDIKTLMLLRAVDKLRWAIDKKPEKMEHYKEYVKTILNYVLT